MLYSINTTLLSSTMPWAKNREREREQTDKGLKGEEKLRDATGRSAVPSPSRNRV